ncbi:MAG: EF-P lysine aminoacylase GenX [Planctomycetaceae bacterium]|nr:EF-P lysine aminoacylase GenX [Planctomycetaceae bacterium]
MDPLSGNPDNSPSDDLSARNEPAAGHPAPDRTPAGEHAEDWRPAASLKMLQLRSRMRTWLREYFTSRGYWEVDTPVLSQDIVVDAWLNPFSIQLPSAIPGSQSAAADRQTLYLQTSPEFAMKRLMAAGAEAIFQLGPAFREGESGRWHNPEFTLLEWYRTGTTYRQQMEFTEDLVCGFLARCHEELATKAEIPVRPFPRLTCQTAFQQATGAPVLELTVPELAELARQVLPAGSPEMGDDRNGWLNLLLAERVEPQLARQPAVFLLDYPDTQAALARIRRETPPVAERFELYLGGIEICNGYQELLDPVELRERNRQQNAVRQQSGNARLPEDSRLLHAMEAGLPECSGVALGFDRLLALATGSRGIAEVLPFPLDRC